MITIVPIRADFLSKVRNANLDDQNQPVERMIAQGGEPCRDVLRRAKPGETLILASYCPFTQPGPYKEYGPVFVLANDAEQTPAMTKLPLPTGSELDYLSDNFVLRAYSSAERIVDAHLTTAANATKTLNQLFADPNVAFVLVRFAAYGCYAMRVERAQ